MSYLLCSTWLEASSLTERPLFAQPGPPIAGCQAPGGPELCPSVFSQQADISDPFSFKSLTLAQGFSLGAKRYRVFSSLGRAPEAFPGSPTQLQTYSLAAPGMGGASVHAHRKGLTPSHVQKRIPDIDDIDYVHSGAWGWLGRVLAPPPMSLLPLFLSPSKHIS